ncbi:unnamed protein product [Nesidiocoris tenuis]|uniref:Uncharacterized protein n=1 Tax=Nesidiocoris tenuis TaxID=355587 RepID=A0A6H5GLY4_9HEMI|nr:unnamed protein product [Nesidiocoris tenuis]
MLLGRSLALRTDVIFENQAADGTPQSIVGKIDPDPRRSQLERQAVRSTVPQEWKMTV